MIVRIHNIGSVGVIKDIPAFDLPPEAWSDAQNMRFESNTALKFKGHEPVYNVTVSAATSTQALAESPWFAHNVQSGGNNYWVYMGANNVNVATLTSNHNNINRLSSTASGTTQYSATPTLRWNGDVLAGLPYYNPSGSADPPQVWPTVATSTRLEDAQWDASAGTTFLTRSAGAVTCKVFRAYREFGILLNTTEGGTSYPRRVRWSHPAVAGAQPDSYENKTTNDAGSKDFDDTKDEIIDGKALRDSFIIYKANYTHSMRYVGGEFVMDFEQVFQFGLLATECVGEFFGRHICLTTDRDVVLHNGVEVDSVINHKWRNFLQNDIDTNYSANSYIAINYEKREVWVCYPESGISEAYWPTKALVWNWQQNTWTIRELPKAAFITNGIIETGGGTVRTWSGLTGTTWSAVEGPWGTRAFQGNARSMLLVYPEDTASSGDTPQLLKIDSTEQFAGDNMEAYLERTGLAIAGYDRAGNPKVDLGSIKLVRKLWPYITAASGTQILISVGSQMHASDGVTWSGPFTYTVGTDSFINCRVSGRYISVRFRSNGAQPWKITGYDLDMDKVGNH